MFEIVDAHAFVQDTTFVSERRAELETYLHTVFELDVWLAKKRQQCMFSIALARFLDFHKYVRCFGGVYLDA
jgi:hypothetical protein